MTLPTKGLFAVAGVLAGSGIAANIVPMLVGGAISFVGAWYLFARTAKAKGIEKLEVAAHGRDLSIAALEKQLALVTQAVVPISAAFQAMLIKELTHFHTPELDALLMKLGPPNTLTDEEEARLAVLLSEREETLNGRISDSERDAAKILPAVIKRARAAAIVHATPAPNGEQLKLVTVTPPPGTEGERR